MRNVLLRTWLTGAAALAVGVLPAACDQGTDPATAPAAEVRAARAAAAESYTAGDGVGAVLRTPDSAFRNLDGYDYAPHYATVYPGGLRMHYLDEGPRGGQVVLLLHGNPAWVYYYRRMIPVLTAAGYRVIAPDLIGFGRSDKPVDRAVQTYNRQVAWVADLVDRLKLKRVTLHCHDWGGLIGLRVAAQDSGDFARIMASDTELPRGDEQVTQIFLYWRNVVSQQTPSWAPIIQSLVTRPLTAGELAAYDAPYPSEAYKAGPRQLPSQVPITPDAPGAAENRAAWAVYDQWTKPFLTAFSDNDPITPGAAAEFQARVPGTRGQPHTTFANTSHYLHEDVAVPMAQLLVRFIEQNPIKNKQK